MLFVPRRYPAPFRLCRCCSSLRQFRRLCRCRESSHMQIGIGPDQGAPHQTMGPQFAKRSRTKRSRNLQITNPVIWGRRRQARNSRRNSWTRIFRPASAKGKGAETDTCRVWSPARWETPLRYLQAGLYQADLVNSVPQMGQSEKSRQAVEFVCERQFGSISPVQDKESIKNRQNRPSGRVFHSLLVMRSGYNFQFFNYGLIRSHFSRQNRSSVWRGPSRSAEMK